MYIIIEALLHSFKNKTREQLPTDGEEFNKFNITIVCSTVQLLRKDKSTQMY